MAARGDGRAALAADIARVYTHDAADKVAAASRQVVEALGPRGAASTLAEGVQRLVAPPAFDVIAARRRIADAVIEAGRYPL
jgi:protein-L-isoaspartate O-methyltransferase